MIRNFKTFIILILITPLLLGCPATTQSMKAKKEVRDELIIEIQNQIKDLGQDPITENEAKYKGKIDKDKYIIALRKQLKEIKEDKDTKKLSDEKKAAEKQKDVDKEKLKQEREKAIQRYKTEIVIMGDTPVLEFEVGSEDKYLAALKKQYEESKKAQQERDAKIKEETPEWWDNMPVGTETVMYSVGTAVSQDMQFARDKAVNAALFDLGKNMQNRLASKNKIMVKEAGLAEDPQLKTNIERAQKIVINNVTITGYKIIKSKTAPRAGTQGYRSYILIEYPISLAYKNYLEEINKEPQIAGRLATLKNTQAYKDLVEAANTYSP